MYPIQIFVKLYTLFVISYLPLDKGFTYRLNRSLLFCLKIIIIQKFLQLTPPLDLIDQALHIIHHDDLRVFATWSPMISNNRPPINTDVIISFCLKFYGGLLNNQCLSRIGRGGRFGRKGVAINFVTDDDQRNLHDIEKFYNTQIDEMPMNVADLI